MKNFLSLFAFSTFLYPLCAFNYEKMAKDIEKSNRDKNITKIAILPFEDLTKEAKNYSRIIQEEFTFAFTKYTKFLVSERSQVDKVIKELELHTSGVISPETAKELGKGLGAEGIVTGSIHKEGNVYKIIARLVKTEDFTVLAATSDEKEEAPLFSKSSKISYSTFASFDIMLGATFAKNSVSFGKPTGYPPVVANQVGFPMAGSYNTIEVNSIKEIATPPIGLRFLFLIPKSGFSPIVGFELLYHSWKISEQSGKAKLNESLEVPIYLGNNYWQAWALEITIPILLGYSMGEGTIYTGLNLGTNLSSFSSDYILSYNYAANSFQKSDAEIGFGFQGAFLAGVRYRFTESVSFFLEIRYFGGFSEFNRDERIEDFLVSEDMTIYRSGFLSFLGIGFLF